MIVSVLSRIYTIKMSTGDSSSDDEPSAKRRKELSKQRRSTIIKTARVKGQSYINYMGKRVEGKCAATDYADDCK